MSPVIKASITLTCAVVVVSLTLYFTGLHQRPLVGGVGSLVVVIGANIAVVLWALKQSASENGYLQQLTNAALIGALAGSLVFAASMILLTLLPNYLAEMQAGQIAALAQWDLPEDELARQTAQIQSITPLVSSFQGTLGTFSTSVIVGAIAAIFQRRKA